MIIFPTCKIPLKPNRKLTEGFLSCGMEKTKPLTYLLCPKCQRTLPVTSKERYCPYDGSRMLCACPPCGAEINSPYSRFCTNCGETLLEDGQYPTRVYIQKARDPTKATRDKPSQKFKAKA
jgi:hypothetical protein